MSKTETKKPQGLTKQDFVSDQMVKWCPGCGAHAILSSILKVFPETGIKKENYCFVSGIGCSSRFPYYVNTYGFHGIHGRAAAIASGVKIANPELSLWVATGDGDSMAIGGNHFIHAIRRNVNMNILLFNNQVYGLTKGQFSPTTPRGGVTKTSPQGTIEHPFVTAGLVMGAQGTFFARCLDNNIKMMTDVISQAAKHNGTSVVEILQSCVIYSDGAFDNVSAKEIRDEVQLRLVHGEPMIFGRNRDKGIILKDNKLTVATIGKDGITKDDILVHDQYRKDPGIHRMLGRMEPPKRPLALGVIRSADFSTYDELMEKQIEAEKKSSPIKNVDDLLNSGDTWEI